MSPAKKKKKGKHRHPPPRYRKKEQDRSARHPQLILPRAVSALASESTYSESTYRVHPVRT